MNVKELHPEWRDPNPSTAALLCWKSHFFMQAVQLSTAAPADRWKWKQQACPELPASLQRAPAGIQECKAGPHWNHKTPRAHIGKRTVLWQTPSCKSSNAVIYKKTTLSSIKISMLPWIVLVLAYINVEEEWSSVWIFPMWNLWHKQLNLRFTYKSKKMLLGQIWMSSNVWDKYRVSHMLLILKLY